MKTFVTIFLLLNIFCTALFAQNNSSHTTGSLNGVLRDSAHNFALQNATLAIYRKADSALISYQLTNNFGEFHFNKLPLDTILLIKASFIGYATYAKAVLIPSSKKNYDLGNINMEMTTSALDEVVIKADPPPVRMNGDTLEFNAQAFRLDTNAVVEDLLRKLPNVEIWSDGMITINGKTVSKVLVEGKEFFGGNASVALQNLPKNSVSKVQVYKEDERNNPIDAKTNLNIVLKKNKKDGFFGKVEGGYGTSRRYDNNGMLNYFDPLNQVSIISSVNNVNKTANTVEGLFNYTSFKGEGISNSYMTDFNKKGVNSFKSIGFTVERSPDKNRSLKAKYFLYDLQTHMAQNTSSTFAQVDNSVVTRSNADSTEQKGYNQNANLEYKVKNQYSEGYLQSDFSQMNRNQTDVTFEESINSASRNSAIYTSNNEKKYSEMQFSLRAGYHSDFFARLNHHPALAFNIDYGFTAFTNENEATRISNVKDQSNNLINSFNRKYNEKNNTRAHSLQFSKDNIFGAGVSNILAISFLNTFETNQNHKEYTTRDFEGSADRYIKNDTLSFVGNYKLLNERPALALKKTFIRSLSNRFSKILSIDFVAKAQFYDQRNTSTIDYQNIHRTYSRFTPSSSISYRDQKMQKYDNLYSISYNTDLIIPQLNQLAPLVDPADGFYLNYGNLDLKPSYRHELTANFSHTDSKATLFIYNASIRAGMVNNFMSDSTIYDNLGRVSHFTVNVNRQKYGSIAGSVLKSYKIKSNLLQLGYKGSVNLYQNPVYINSEYVLAKTLSSDNSIDVSYNYNALLAFKIIQSLQTFKTTQRRNDIQTDFKNINTNTTLAVSLMWPKHVILNNNVNYGRSISPGMPPINFTIWNANVSYRFLKGENGEIKFSALDILHQNTGLINYGGYNSITRGTAKVLQQYFMISVSYFPRKFGLNNNN